MVTLSIKTKVGYIKDTKHLLYNDINVNANADESYNDEDIIDPQFHEFYEEEDEASEQVILEELREMEIEENEENNVMMYTNKRSIPSDNDSSAKRLKICDM